MIISPKQYHEKVAETNQENETMQSSNSSSSGGTYQTPAGISANASTEATEENSTQHTGIAVVRRPQPNQQELLRLKRYLLVKL